jgi:hypothetical protein
MCICEYDIAHWNKSFEWNDLQKWHYIWLWFSVSLLLLNVFFLCVSFKLFTWVWLSSKMLISKVIVCVVYANSNFDHSFVRIFKILNLSKDNWIVSTGEEYIDRDARYNIDGTNLAFGTLLLHVNCESDRVIPWENDHAWHQGSEIFKISVFFWHNSKKKNRTHLGGA